MDESNINYIDISKYKYIEFDEFISISKEAEAKYDFLLICYSKLPILSTEFDFFYKKYYEAEKSLENIENKIKNTNLNKVILLHDLHYNMFKNGYVAFFNYCKYLNIKSVVSIYSDNFEYNIIKAYCDGYNLNLFIIPHLIDESIFKDYKQQKIYDILLYGETRFECYSFRKRIKNLLENNYHNFNIKILNNTNEYTKEKLSIEINKAYITIATKSSFDYFLMKYIETPLSGSLIAGDIPSQSNDFNLSTNMVILNEKMSDLEILYKLENELSNKYGINEKIKQQFNNIEYLKLKYKPYYYTLLFDKIIEN